MQEKQIEDIKNALREMIQLLTQRGEPLSDELKAKVAQVMEHAANRITQLRQEQQTETGQQPPNEPLQQPTGAPQAPIQPIQESNAPTPSTPVTAPTPPTEELPGAPYASSNINAFQYDYKTGKLVVRFQGKDVADNGPIYSYEGVPKFIYDIFRQGAVAPKTSGSNRWHTWKRGVTPSHGAAMYHLIRDRYPYQRVG